MSVLAQSMCQLCIHDICCRYHADIGDDQDQVLAKWDEPSSKQNTAEGEVWRYANQAWKRHVPYYGTFAHVEEPFVLFGADGKMIKSGTEDFGHAFQEPWRRRYGTN